MYLRSKKSRTISLYYKHVCLDSMGLVNDIPWTPVSGILRPFIDVLMTYHIFSCFLHSAFLYYFTLPDYNDDNTYNVHLRIVSPFFLGHRPNRYIIISVASSTRCVFVLSVFSQQFTFKFVSSHTNARQQNPRYVLTAGPVHELLYS